MSVAVAEPARVYFDPPVCFQVNPPTVNGRKAQYLYGEVTEIARKLRMAGWDHRAIVVKRQFYAGSGWPNMTEMAKTSSWGAVLQITTTVSADRPYLPLKVVWFVDGSITEHWPEELFLVHESMTQTELDKQFTAEKASDPCV